MKRPMAETLYPAKARVSLTSVREHFIWSTGAFFFQSFSWPSVNWNWRWQRPSSTKYFFSSSACCSLQNYVHFFFLIQIYTESQTHQYLPNSCLFSSHLYYLTLLFLVSSVPRYRIKHLYQMLLQNHGGPQLSASRVHVLMAPSLIPSLSQYLF